jgi:hypothetical protein
VAGQDSKTLVCKIGGSTGTGSIVVGDIGTLIVDGSVTWQVASRVPFAVQAVPTQINGQDVPAGVYIDAAYVLNATIQNTQIADLAVDDQKIASLNVDKLTAGSLQTDSYVQSSNYVEGEQGFRISANGQAEFQNAVVRGAVFAESGTFAGSLSAATGTFSGALEAATGSFSGSLSAATGTFSGALEAATGTFSGSLSAATGTFSGSLTADAIDAVNTVNIAGQAVTIPTNAYINGEIPIPKDNWTTVIELTYTSSGNPSFITFSFFFRTISGNIPTGRQLRVLKNGVPVLNPISFDGFFGQLPISYSFADSNTAGSVSYTFQVISSSAFQGGFMAVSSRAATALEVKR